MDILSEAESRSFSQFLDNFSSTTTPAPASDPNFFPPPSGQRTRVQHGAAEKLAGLSRIDAAGGAAPLGGWAERAAGGGGGAGPSKKEGPVLSSGRRHSSHARTDTATVTATAMSGFGYGARQLPPPPHLAFTGGPSSFPPPIPHPHFNANFPLPPPSTLSALSTQPRASTFRHQIYCTPPTASTSSSSFLPSSLAYPAPTLSSSYLSTSSSYPHYPPPPPLSPDSQAEQKRARMAQQAGELKAMLRTTESGRMTVKGRGEELEEAVEEEEDEDGPPLKRTKSDEAVPGEQVGQLPVMLETEERGGSRSSRSSKRSQQQSDFAPLPHPPVSAPPAQEQLPPSPPPRRSASRRKAPAPRKSRASSKAAAVAIDPEDSASPPVASTSSTLFPFPTPPNIPFAPLRSSRPPSTTATARKPSPSSASPPPPPAAGTKPALLTAAQKKANHIASEQKRRAAIRAGYDGLCEVVPSLRAAVEEYEERLAAVSGAGAGVGRGGKKGRTGRGRSGESTTGALMGGIEVGGEKVDGRAGPKSEAVVLSKTVEHLRTLLSARQTLLTRLAASYSSASAHSIPLPPPAPAGYPGMKQVAGEWDEVWEDGWMEREVLSMLGLPVKDEEDEVREEAGFDELDEDVPGA